MKAVNLFNQIQKLRYLARTRIAVDIENLGKNTKCIAVREKNSTKELRQGVWLSKECRELSENNFTNIYDLFWNPNEKKLIPNIRSSNTPYFLADQIKKDERVVATINGGFFFLTDIADRKPLDLPYDLCIREGELFGLPSYDQPVAFIQNGRLHAQEIYATGTIMINKKKLRWVGAKGVLKGSRNYSAVLYNSKCSDIKKVRDENNIQIGILDNENIRTPKRRGVVDIVVVKNENGKLVVAQLHKGGGTHFFDGLFILQTEMSDDYKIGSAIVPLTLENLELNKISSAITIGRSVHNPFFFEQVRIDRRDARSILAEDVKGNLHFMVFDGSKYVPGFRGVSAKDISSYFSPDRFHWAYFLDGGGSTRLIVRDKGGLDYLANAFAFRKLNDGSVLWDWQKARELASSIVLSEIEN